MVNVLPLTKLFSLLADEILQSANQSYKINSMQQILRCTSVFYSI